MFQTTINIKNGVSFFRLGDEQGLLVGDVFVSGFRHYQKGDCFEEIKTASFVNDGCGLWGAGVSIEDAVPVAVGEGYVMIPLGVYNAAVDSNLVWLEAVVRGGLVAAVAAVAVALAVGWLLQKRGE